MPAKVFKSKNHHGFIMPNGTVISTRGVIVDTDSELGKGLMALAGDAPSKPLTVHEDTSKVLVRVNQPTSANPNSFAELSAISHPTAQIRREPVKPAAVAAPAPKPVAAPVVEAPVIAPPVIAAPVIANVPAPVDTPPIVEAPVVPSQLVADKPSKKSKGGLQLTPAS